MKKINLITPLLIAGTLFLSNCKKKTDEAGNPLASTQVETSCTDINLFSISQDVMLGAQVDSQIRATPAEYVILDSSSNAFAYQYMNKIKKEIFDNAAVDYEETFRWKIAIIKEDNTLNAFCTPGGYIYVYTGIIKYLDNEDDFAGVLGHEIGHAALRHSTDAMAREQGVGTLINIVLGKSPGILATLAKNLSDLKYSRCHETQSDEYSVIMLKNTKYKCDGAASFFKKIEAEGGSSTPAFLSTHPSPGSRVENITAKATKEGCTGKTAAETDWAKLKSELGLVSK